MRVLITGAAGFAGSHLADYLVTHTPHEVWGVVRRTRWRISHLAGQLHLVQCDLTDPVATVDMVREVRPDIVYHLAADARVGASCKHPW